MITEAIILAGGLGTRLREAVPDLPKCMAPVAGRPFLDYLIKYLQQQGIQHFIFSLGYKHLIIENFLKDSFPLLHYTCLIETEPLGTGGAIKLACNETNKKNVFVFNGDTFFKVNLQKLASFHIDVEADCTLSLKPMKDFDRYGVVETGKQGNLQLFKEKNNYAEGLINGGVYALNANHFLALPLPEIFSFEKDYLEKYYTKQKIYALVQDEYFIDIGVREDLEKANRDFGNM